MEFDLGEMITSPAAWWLIAFAVLLIVELVTMGLTTIWFAGGALIAALVAALGGGLVLQIVVFLAASFVLLLATRPIAVKYLNRTRVKTNADSLVGKVGIVLQSIDNIKAEGKVEINGMEWTARSGQDDLKIEKGRQVEVLEIQGVKLIVKEKEN